MLCPATWRPRNDGISTPLRPFDAIGGGFVGWPAADLSIAVLQFFARLHVRRLKLAIAYLVLTKNVPASHRYRLSARNGGRPFRASPCVSVSQVGKRLAGVF